MKKNEKLKCIEHMINSAVTHFFEEMGDNVVNSYIQLFTYNQVKNSKNIFDLIDTESVVVSMSSFIYGYDHDDDDFYDIDTFINDAKNINNEDFNIFELSRHELSKIRFLTILSYDGSPGYGERTRSGFLYDIFKGIAYPIEEKYKVTGFRKKEVFSRDFPDEIKF